MSRPRKSKYSGLPPNLHFDSTNRCFRYWRPDQAKYYLMGKDRNKAVIAAKQLNSLLLPGQDLVSQVMGGNSTLTHYIDTHFTIDILPERDLSQTTYKNYINQLSNIKNEIGELPINEITINHVAKFLRDFPPTQSNRYRSLLHLIFKYAVAEGLTENNPVADTISRKAKKIRKRISLEHFKIIYNQGELWLKNAMDIALLTAQRREDIVNMKFTDIRDNHLYVIQKKTSKHGSLSHLKIEMGAQLQNVVSRCRDNIASPFLIHRLPSSKKRCESKEHYTQVTADYLTKEFSKSRDRTDLFNHLGPSEKPTFHEIRSLSLKLYKDAGHNPQILAGHSSPQMTEKYLSGHETDWTLAIADLNIQVEN